MLRQYETVFILTPVLSELQAKEAVDKFREILKSNNAEIIHEENWGLRKLAYPIKHKSSGYYNLLEFKADTTLIERLEIEYKRDERIIRFLSFKLDKYASEYSNRKRLKKQAAANVEQLEKKEE